MNLKNWNVILIFSICSFYIQTGPVSASSSDTWIHPVGVTHDDYFKYSVPSVHSRCCVVH